MVDPTKEQMTASSVSIENTARIRPWNLRDYSCPLIFTIIVATSILWGALFFPAVQLWQSAWWCILLDHSASGAGAAESAVLTTSMDHGTCCLFVVVLLIIPVLIHLQEGTTNSVTIYDEGLQRNHWRHWRSNEYDIYWSNDSISIQPPSTTVQLNPPWITDPRFLGGQARPIHQNWLWIRHGRISANPTSIETGAITTYAVPVSAKLGLKISW